MSEDEGFLQRWSRRKQTALQDDEPADKEGSDSAHGDDEPAVPEQVAADSSSDQLDAASSEAAEPEPEPPGDEDMPPLESIDESGDVSPFFSPRVSEALRQAALRRLFRQPKYNVVDMLDDYAEDYSKPALLGNIVTADMRYRAEQAAKRLERIYKESLADNDAGDGKPEPTADPQAASRDEGADSPALASKEGPVLESDAVADAEQPAPTPTDEEENPPEDSGHKPV